MLWPSVAVLGFLLLTCIVVSLGMSSTAAYEFERNRVPQPKPEQKARTRGAHPAGSRLPAARTGDEAGATRAAAVEQSVAVAERPAADAEPATGWWLVEEDVDEGRARVVAGPFADRVEADWAALAYGLEAGAVHGVRRADGLVVPRPTPQEQAWLTELGEQLDRLPEEWDEVLTDTDELTTLVVEVAAALVEAGLPLHDCARDTTAGGVCLTPEPELRGVLVSWRQHDRMSIEQVRGAMADATVQLLMNIVLADVLSELEFEVEAFGTTGCHLVTAAAR